jgi:hypothetical protein
MARWVHGRTLVQALTGAVLLCLVLAACNALLGPRDFAFTSCVTDSDCSSHESCSTAHACALANGQACDPSADGGDCATAFCSSDQVCCAEACSAPCQACSDGAHCSNLPAGSPGACGPGQVCSADGGCIAHVCDTASECPGPNPPNPCARAGCDVTNQTCTIVDVAAGGLADPSVQVKGNCKKVTCDGMGNAMLVDDDTNVPISSSVCLTPSCHGGLPILTFLTGPCTENGGKVCGSPSDPMVAGHCVACNVDADCAVNVICQVHQCIPSHCNDSVQDGDETDVDCGGSCSPCANNLKCLLGSDCQSGSCGLTHTCTPASCSDGIQNQGETDIDCGGPVCRTQSKLCGTGQGCTISADCQSFDCNLVTHKCLAPTCIDGIQNQGETAIDCGGTNCPGCALGKTCKVDADCMSMGCQTATKVCVPPCTDGQRDGNETDVDCGGTMCPPCLLDLGCLVDTDCFSNACDALSHKCVMDQCADHLQDGTETDVDCGGTACPACASGKMCLVNSDCASNHCNGSHQCM